VGGSLAVSRIEPVMKKNYRDDEIKDKQGLRGVKRKEFGEAGAWWGMGGGGGGVTGNV